MVVILAIAGGSYWWLYAQISGAGTTDISLTDAVAGTLVDAIDPPSGMDILVMGSDKRRNAEAGIESRSDTVMLVHVDPEEDYLSILSLPRDLRVEIPGHGIDKLNAAYAFEGPSLTVKTIEQLTNVDIDAYLEIDFKAFEDLTDSLGGVYVDVDRRYYNDDPEAYELIKISPGYQLLDGQQALDYVRFRHDLNYDFGRMDRQQRFIAAAREQAMGWNLGLKLPGLISALFDNVQTTIGANDMLGLAYWGAKLDGSRIRQISVVGDTAMRDGVSYVIPMDGAVEEAVDKFLTPPESESGTGGETVTSQASTTTTEGDMVEFITDPAEIYNSRLWGLVADSVPFTVMAPGYLPSGYAYIDRQPKDGGAYEIVPGDSDKVGFKMVYRLTRNGQETDQYLGIMQTNWTDAPAASPGQQVEYNGVVFTVVGTNQKVDRIWWKQNDTLYWVSNTLSFYLSKKELLRVAESMITIPTTTVGVR